jgi:ribosomal protein S18 acetylase RimI-like enzyme
VEKDSETAEVLVRPARPADREAVLSFCRDTWDDGDYIENVWEDWLVDESGRLLVAVAGDQPVGLIHLAMLSTEDAWLEGIRVAPTARRRGIARVMTSQALVLARQRGACVVRLLTDSDNIASQGLVTKKFGFQRVAEVVRYTAPALPAGNHSDADVLLETEDMAASTSERSEQQESAPGPRLLLASEEDHTRLQDWLLHSNLAPINGGLQFGRWNAWALREADMQDYLARGEVWMLEEWESIQAIAVVRERPGRETFAPTLEVRYIDGSSGGIGMLALTLREIAEERHLTQVEFWLPDLLILQDAMNGAGYTRGSQEKMWVYQRDL